MILPGTMGKKDTIRIMHKICVFAVHFCVFFLIIQILQNYLSNAVAVKYTKSQL